MSVIDEVLAANALYKETHDASLYSPEPRRKLAVLMCMDTRLDRHALGIDFGDAHFIRNAGGIATEDAIRSLLISHYMLGTEEVMVINHTDCGLQKASESEMRAVMESKAGKPANFPLHFYAFTDVAKNVLEQLERLASHSWVRKELILRGFVYDVMTGHLTEVPWTCRRE
ncbi:MAG TPA: carbonic anhydrase [Candidatus Saccharimonadales bacterium]|nr:carbonic anhydrase [Candidatus Saccharimonadales bacterium]